MARRGKHEESVHHERWLVSYADFMTLLFALFVVLFASSQHDKKTIQRVSSAVRNGFEDLGAFSSSTGNVGPQRANAFESNTKDIPAPAPAAEQHSAGIDTVELQRKLSKAMGKEIEHQEVEMKMTPEGFVISLHELGFFNSGAATLLPGAADKIKRIAAVLMEYGLDMRVEGHTDNVPIHNQLFASNWDLSIARASTVAMMLLDDARFDPRRMAIAGYGEYHPTASNDTPEGRQANRRVDIVIVAIDKQPPAPAPVPASIPTPTPAAKQQR